MEPCIVLMNGLPAVGKLCILKNIQKGLSRKNKMFQSSLLTDPAKAVYPDKNSRQHKAFCKILREAAFPDIAGIVRQGTTVFMTACITNNREDFHVMIEYLVLARAAGVRLLWINAHCHPQILKERAHWAHRVRGQKTKLSEWDFLDERFAQVRLVWPPNYPKIFMGLDFTFVDMDVSGPLEDTVEKITELIRYPGRISGDIRTPEDAY